MLQYLHSTCTSQDQLQIVSLCSCTGKQHNASKDRLFSSSQTEMDPLQNLIFFWTVDVRTFEQFDMRTFLYLFETWLQRQMLGHNMTANVFPLQTTCSYYLEIFLNNKNGTIFSEAYKVSKSRFWFGNSGCFLG